MHCKRAQTDIALWAGNDLDESNLFDLRNHLQVCPPCRAYLEEMRALMRLVEECPLRNEVDETAKFAVAESLWTPLSTRLISLPTPRTDHFNGWIPAVAVAAVCLAMVLVASPPRLLAPNDASTLSVNAEEALDVNPSSSGHALPMAPPDRFPIDGTPVDLRGTSPHQVPPLRNDLEREWSNEGFPSNVLDDPLFREREQSFGQEQNRPPRTAVYIFRR